MATQPPDEAAGYERRIRIASELATWGTSFVLVASAALPTTDETSRLGLLFSAFMFAAFALLWFRLLPARIFGPRRFTIGTAITQLISAALLVLTGGADSNYFVFFFLPTLATTFAMRLFATVVTGTIAIASYFVVLAADVAVTPDRVLLETGAVRLSALFALIAMSALITKTMQDTHRTSSSTSRALRRSRSPALTISPRSRVRCSKSRDRHSTSTASFSSRVASSWMRATPSVSMARPRRSKAIPGSSIPLGCVPSAAGGRWS